MPADARDEKEGSGALADSIEEVFRTMLGQECSAIRSGGPFDGIAATIEFSGALAGRCTVIMRESAAFRLTDVLLHCGGQWDQQMIDDAVGELCNMVVGGWKSRVEGVRSNCHLSVPSVSRLPRVLDAVLPVRSLRRRYGFDGHELDVCLEIES